MSYNLLEIPTVFAKSFGKYIEQGFVKMSIDFNFEDINEDCKVTLKNIQIDRNLYFRFQTYNGPNKAFIAEFVYFSIDKRDGKNILLEHYWKQKKGNDYRIVSLINQIKGDTFEERLKNYFDIVKDTLENELKAVVEGKEWIDLHYDPRDDYV